MTGVPFVDLEPSHADLAEALDEAWRKTTDSNAFILGPMLERFESEWADYCGVDHAIGVANGTDALELILRSLGIGPGDEVIVPATTFVATAAAVVAAGAQPVFTDVDESTLLITGDHLRAAVTERTAAVIAVHLYGNTCDIDELQPVASAASIALIEDAAQAHGARQRGVPAGSLGRAAGFSHYPTKNLGAFGDAGSVTTNDESLAEQIRRLRNHGRPTQSSPTYEQVGRTSRLDGLQAAILSAKLPHLDDWIDQRRQAVDWYEEYLPHWIPSIKAGEWSASSPHLFVVRVPGRDSVREALTSAGIGTGIHYPDPVPRTPAFGGVEGAFPVAEAAADSIVSLPMWPGLSEAQVARVCEALTDSLSSSPL